MLKKKNSYNVYSRIWRKHDTNIKNCYDMTLMREKWENEESNPRHRLWIKMNKKKKKGKSHEHKILLWPDTNEREMRKLEIEPKT